MARELFASDGAGRITEALDAVRACLPRRSIESFELLGEGDFCTAYLMDGGEVVRISKHGEARAALAREACLLATLPTLALPTPLPTHLSSASAEVGVSIHEIVPGAELSREIWSGMAEAERSAIARSVGHFLQGLHSVEVSLGERCGLPVTDHHAEIAELCVRLAGPPGGALPPGLRQGLSFAFRSYVADPARSSYDSAILHGDFGPGHVLFDRDRRVLTGVIDWGDARIGDPARDFVFVYEDWGREFLTMALEGYEVESPAALLPRVYLYYLADQLAWTLNADTQRRRDDTAHAIAALERGLLELEDEE